MDMNRRQYLETGLAALTTSVFAGCSSSGGGANEEPSVTGSQGERGRYSETLNVFSHDEYGDIIVGPSGLSVYRFSEDTKGTVTCYGQCAATWPPLLAETSSPSKASDITATIGTITRNSGNSNNSETNQIAANRYPLYQHTPDKQPGDTNGQGVTSFGGTWYLVAPDGSTITG